jgi:hypothetical protein
MECDEGNPLPDKFASLAGGVFPLYHVLADAGQFAGGSAAAVATSAPLAVDALALTRGSDRCVIVANLTAQRRQAVLSWAGAARLRARQMDAASLTDAMGQPESFRASAGKVLTASDGRIVLDLPPHAVVRVDAK